MIAPRITGQDRESVFFNKIDKFRGGTQTYVNEARTSTEYATESTNLIQKQDGIWQTRPGVAYYGQEVTGEDTLDGAFEYEKTDGTRETIVIGGTTGAIYKSTDGGAWSTISGATLTAGNKPSFQQINTVLYITNGVDPMTIYDGSSLSQYTAISAPGTPSASAGAGLTTGSGYDNYYRIQATNSVGRTTPSATSLHVQTDKLRDYWSTTSSDYLDLSWTAVTGADGYEIYWGEFDGFEYLIGRSTTNSFRDQGETVNPKNIYVETADDNTTGSPKYRKLEISGSRIWGTYDPDNKWRVGWTGTGSRIGYFSAFYGGGDVDIEYGGKNRPYDVVHYRTGKGDPITTVLCSSANGNGSIFQIELSAQTVGDVSITIPIVYKIIGSIGTDCPWGVIKEGDNVMFPNRKGVYALRNKQQIYNVLATDNLITNVRDQWNSLNFSNIENFVGYYKDPYVFLSVSEGNENDITAVYDSERKNWSWKWSVGFKQFLEYTDNSSSQTTHFLAVPTSGNRLAEISDNITGDYGEAFYQSYISPLIPVDKDYTTLAKVREAIAEIGNFQGTVTFTILGIQKNKTLAVIAQKTKSSSTGTTGWGDDFFSDFLFSDTSGTPTKFNERTSKITVNVGKKLHYIQYQVSANAANTHFELLGLQSRGYKLPGRPDSTWN